MRPYPGEHSGHDGDGEEEGRWGLAHLDDGLGLGEAEDPAGGHMDDLGKVQMRTHHIFLLHVELWN